MGNDMISLQDAIGMIALAGLPEDWEGRVNRGELEILPDFCRQELKERQQPKSRGVCLPDGTRAPDAQQVKAGDVLAWHAYEILWLHARGTIKQAARDGYLIAQGRERDNPRYVDVDPDYWAGAGLDEFENDQHGKQARLPPGVLWPSQAAAMNGKACVFYGLRFPAKSIAALCRKSGVLAAKVNNPDISEKDLQAAVKSVSARVPTGDTITQDDIWQQLKELHPDKYIPRKRALNAFTTYAPHVLAKRPGRKGKAR